MDIGKEEESFVTEPIEDPWAETPGGQPARPDAVPIPVETPVTEEPLVPA